MTAPRGLARAARRAAPPPGGTWTILHLVEWSAGYLADRGVPEARLDAEHLLAGTLGTGRLDLYLDFDRPLTPGELARFRPRLLERARRRPLQYILARVPFRALELTVNESVLIPRPETEELVGAVLGASGGSGPGCPRALDIGTGSGAIALSLAKEGAFGRVVATDVSDAALEVARLNARTNALRSRVEFRAGDLFAPVANGERFDVVVSNPPYVSPEEFDALAPEVRLYEPREGLVAGGGGLAVLMRLVEGAGAVLAPGALFALEVGAGQAHAVAARIRETGGFAAPTLIRDLAGVDRIVVARWHGASGARAAGRGGRRASRPVVEPDGK